MPLKEHIFDKQVKVEVGAVVSCEYERTFKVVLSGGPDDGALKVANVVLDLIRDKLGKVLHHITLLVQLGPRVMEDAVMRNFERLHMVYLQHAVGAVVGLGIEENGFDTGLVLALVSTAVYDLRAHVGLLYARIAPGALVVNLQSRQWFLRTSAGEGHAPRINPFEMIAIQPDEVDILHLHNARERCVRLLGTEATRQIEERLQERRTLQLVDGAGVAYSQRNLAGDPIDAMEAYRHLSSILELDEDLIHNCTVRRRESPHPPHASIADAVVFEVIASRGGVDQEHDLAVYEERHTFGYQFIDLTTFDRFSERFNPTFEGVLVLAVRAQHLEAFIVKLIRLLVARGREHRHRLVRPAHLSFPLFERLEPRVKQTKVR